MIVKSNIFNCLFCSQVIESDMDLMIPGDVVICEHCGNKMHVIGIKKFEVEVQKHAV